MWFTDIIDNLFPQSNIPQYYSNLKRKIYQEKMLLSARGAVCFQQKAAGERAGWSGGWCTGGFDYYHGKFIPNRHEPPGWNETTLTRHFSKLVWPACFVLWSWRRCSYSGPPTVVFGPSPTLNDYTVRRQVVVLVSVPVLKNTDS